MGYLTATGPPDDTFPPSAPHAPPQGIGSCKRPQLAVTAFPGVAGSLW